MEIREIHKWDVDINEAKAIQENLRKEILLTHFSGKLRYVAGVDVAYSKVRNLLFGVVVILNYPELEIIREYYGECEENFPYVPGYLSFREAPVIVQVFKRVEIEPDLVMVDGQGVAHPRRFGLAAHLGVIINLPTIGCAKSLLCGSVGTLGINKGSYAPIYLDGEICGFAIRTRSGKKPVFVSPGNLVSFDDICELVLKCTGRYRVPEPTRLAHIKVNEYRRIYEG